MSNKVLHNEAVDNESVDAVKVEYEHEDFEFTLEIVPKGRLPRVPVLMQTEYA